MRTWLRVLLLAVVVSLAGIAGMEIARGRLEQSDLLRESLEAVAGAQLGVVLRPGAIGVRFVPAQLRLRDSALELPGNARLTLGDVLVDLELFALLAGDARMRALSISGPARLVHGQLALGGELDLELRPGDARQPWSLRADAQLESGGQIEVSGGLIDGGSFEGDIRFMGVEVQPFAVYLESDRGEHPQLRGLYDGTLELPPVGGSLATMRVASEAAEIRVSQVSLIGPVALVAQLPVSASSGDHGARFAIDASRARVEYAGGPVRGSGRGASLGGRIVRGADGRLRLEEVGLKVTRFKGEAGRTDGDAG